MSKIVSFIIAAIILLISFSHKQLPETIPVEVSPLSTKGNAYLLPLDSRPVCTTQPQKLAYLAGTNLILPPKELLDNYRQPGDKEKLALWLSTIAKTPSDNIYISTDMLLYGGLLSSRQNSLSAKQQQQLSLYLKGLSLSTQSNLNIFSIIPRLLVSDELLPDRWYKYKLLRYSQLYHQSLTTGDFASAKALEEYRREIPENILNKYTWLFKGNLQLLSQLIKDSSVKQTLLIGQDDGHNWGLPSLTAQILEEQKIRQKSLYTNITYGADEIASIMVAKNYLESKNAHPAFYIQYAHPSLPNLHMPYMAASIDSVLREKLAYIGASLAKSPETADIILYVSCGNDNYQPSKHEAICLKQLLVTGKKIALIDLTANFEKEELLLPQALENNVPLNKLIAYGGWNTFSNSAGTTIAQAAIFWKREKDLTNPRDRLSLATANLELIVHQLLDNYFYQKEYHAHLKNNLLWRGVTPTNLTDKDKRIAEAFINNFIKQKAAYLLFRNLGQTPFYADNNKEYYVKSYSVSATLPWNRIFEVDILLKDFTIGYHPI